MSMPQLRLADIAGRYNQGRGQRLQEIGVEQKLQDAAFKRQQAAEAQRIQSEVLSGIEGGGGRISMRDLVRLGGVAPDLAKSLAQVQLKNQEFEYNEQANPFRLQDLSLKPQATIAQIDQRRASADSSRASAASSRVSAARNQQGIALDRNKDARAQQKFAMERAMAELDFQIKRGTLNEAQAVDMYAGMEQIDQLPEDQRGAAYDAFQAQMGVPEGQRDAYDPVTFNAEKSALGIRSGLVKPSGKADNFDNETKLRKEFVNESKDFVKVRDAFARLQPAVQNPSAAGDLALIFNYMKILDPGSVVREGEFATAQNAGGVDDRVRNVYNKIRKGERLSPRQRQDFFNQAQALYQTQENLHTQRVGSYSDIASRNDLNVQNVITDLPIQGMPSGSQTQSQGPVQVNTEAEALAQPVGTRVILNGQEFTVEE